MVFAFYKEFGKVDVLMAEALALLHGLNLCQEKGFSSFAIEVDSKALVQLVQLGLVSRWPLCHFLQPICLLLRDLNTSLSHVFREANTAVDAIAAAKLDTDLLLTPPDLLPSKVQFTIRLDLLYVSYVRMPRIRE